MKDLRASKQRTAILDFLRSTVEHPTAETIYANVRIKLPNISLGTVYRNLTLLEELGQVRKLTIAGEPDRFDADITPHSHLKCSACGGVSDIFFDDSNLDTFAAKASGCDIKWHDIIFYGTCLKCKN